MPNNKGKRWTEEETTLAYALYCEIPFGQITGRNPKVIKLTQLLGRTELYNFMCKDEQFLKLNSNWV